MKLYEITLVMAALNFFTFFLGQLNVTAHPVPLLGIVAAVNFYCWRILSPKSK